MWVLSPRRFFVLMYNLRMNILVIGSGGREHALIWKLKQSLKVKNIFAAPGNGGTAQIAENVSAHTLDEIVMFLKKEKIDLVVVGPDSYLAEGLVDKVSKLGIPIFGPTKAAAEIEWSKSFAKNFMVEEGIPTAQFSTFTDINKAKEYIKEQSYPLVLKANGLALGKGVVIAQDHEEALQTLDNMMNSRVFGDAGDEVVVEEFMEGREISIHAFCDGEDAVLFPSSQDHKRIFEGDVGPNTGGMGTIAPVPWVTDEMMKEIEIKIIIPTMQGLKKRGRPFKGVLFPGIIFTKGGPKVIEFNARFGDPETQSYMRLLKADLLDILFACINGNIKEMKIEWEDKYACCIVLASGGYPGKYEKEMPIKLGNFSDDIVLFHAGAKSIQQDMVTDGGRVLGVTATGNTLGDSLAEAYESIKNINFKSMQYRKDIGQKSLN